MPAFLEVEDGAFKGTAACSYADVLAARERERDFRRRGQINALLRVCQARWCEKPSLTVEEILDAPQDE
jgi:hypothetical protein